MASDASWPAACFAALAAATFSAFAWFAAAFFAAASCAADSLAAAAAALLSAALAAAASLAALASSASAFLLAASKRAISCSCAASSLALASIALTSTAASLRARVGKTEAASPNAGAAVENAADVYEGWTVPRGNTEACASSAPALFTVPVESRAASAAAAIGPDVLGPPLGGRGSGVFISARA